MHDCPTCKVPLHGHEEVCPSCGTRQYVRPEYRKSNLPPPPGINPWPFVVIAVIIGIIGIGALQSSWIGQVFTHPVQEDPLSKLTPIDARTNIENGINSGVTAAGSKAVFKYTSGGQPAQKNTAGIVELTVDASLSDWNQVRSIVDPIKDYMAPAKMSTLTFNDEPHHRSRTYTATITEPEKESNDVSTESDTGTQSQPTQPAPQQ